MYFDGVDRASGNAGAAAIAGCIVNPDFKPPPERGPGYNRFLSTAFDTAHTRGSTRGQAVSGNHGEAGPWKLFVG